MRDMLELLVINLTMSHGESGHGFPHGVPPPIFRIGYPYFFRASIKPRERAAAAAPWRVVASSRAMMADT